MRSQKNFACLLFFYSFVSYSHAQWKHPLLDQKTGWINAEKNGDVVVVVKVPNLANFLTRFNSKGDSIIAPFLGYQNYNLSSADTTADGGYILALSSAKDNLLVRLNKDLKVTLQKNSTVFRNPLFDVRELSDGTYMAMDFFDNRYKLYHINQQGDTLSSLPINTDVIYNIFPLVGTDAVVYPTGQGNVVAMRVTGEPLWTWDKNIENNTVLYDLNSAILANTPTKLKLIDPNGLLLWEKDINEFPAFQTIVPLNDRTFLITNRLQTATKAFVTVSKIDSSGSVSWTLTDGQSNEFDLLINNAFVKGTDIYITGTTLSGFNPALKLIKVNNQGKVSWTKSFDGEGFTLSSSVSDQGEVYAYCSDTASSVLYRIDTVNVLGNTPPMNGVQNSVTCFQNPFSETASFVFKGNPAMFELSDMYGRVLKQINLQHSTTYNLEKSTLQPGLYFYKVVFADGTQNGDKLLLD